MSRDTHSVPRSDWSIVEEELRHDIVAILLAIWSCASCRECVCRMYGIYCFIILFYCTNAWSL